MPSLLSEVFMESEGEWDFNSRPVNLSTIPSGPYQTNPAPITGCSVLDTDVASLMQAISIFNNSPVSPTPDPTSPREKARTSLRISLQAMLRKINSGEYGKGGCTKENLRRAGQRIRRISGIWIGARGGIRQLRLRLLQLLAR